MWFNSIVILIFLIFHFYSETTAIADDYIGDLKFIHFVLRPVKLHQSNNSLGLIGYLFFRARPR